MWIKFYKKYLDKLQKICLFFNKRKKTVYVKKIKGGNENEKT